MAQDRKVFVGGVPQDLNQDDLYAIFSEYAGVKKAWLQKCRTTDDSNACPPQNHRGFGFVIFHDSHAIDELIGSAPSRFIMLRNGAKLEVKRALSSNKMSAPQADVVSAGLLEQQAASKVAPRVPPAVRGAEMAALLQSLPQPQRPAPTVAKVAQAAQAQWSAAAAAAAGSNAILRQLSLMQPYGLPGQGIPGIPANPLAAAGYAAAAAAAVPRDSGLNRHALLRNAIVQFYNENCPEKLTEKDFIDFICSVYEGREVELDEALRQKYGMGLHLQSSVQQAHAVSELASRRAAAAAAAAASLGLGLGPANFQDPNYTGLAEVWLSQSPAAAAAAAATAVAQQQQAAQAAMQAAALKAAQKQAVQKEQQRQHLPLPLIDPAIADAYLSSTAYCALAAAGVPHKVLLHELEGLKTEIEVPDVSWIDQIVAEDAGLELPDEVRKSTVEGFVADRRLVRVR